jgi:hypothetical protein
VEVDGERTAYSMFHCWTLIDALNLKKSELVQWDDGTIDRVLR